MLSRIQYWKYERAPTNEMSYLRRLLLAIKIGAVGPIMHSALSDRLGLVPTLFFDAVLRAHELLGLSDCVG